MNNQEIEKYFDDLARRHKRVAHSDSRKRFFRLELEDILLDKMKSVTYFPFISLERMDYRFTGTAGQKGKRKTIAFDVIDKVENITPDKVNAAYDRCEDIADDFITKIWNDCQTNAFPFNEIDWNSIDAAQIPLNETTRVIGVRIVFDVLIPFNSTINKNTWQ